MTVFRNGQLQLPTSRIRAPSVEWFAEAPWRRVAVCTKQVSRYQELQSVQNRCLDILEVPGTSLSTLNEKCKEATKQELERILNDINHPDQIFHTKANTRNSKTYQIVFRKTPPFMICFFLLALVVILLNSN